MKLLLFVLPLLQVLSHNLAKFNELDPCVPDYSYLNEFYKKYIPSIDLILKYEKYCLAKINYQITNITTYSYIQIIVFLGFIFSDERNKLFGINTNSSTQQTIKKRKDSNQSTLSISDIYDTPFEILKIVIFGIIH